MRSMVGEPGPEWVVPLIPYTIRPARADDSRFIYELAADPRIRMNSTRQDEFTWKQHCEWWARKRSDGLNAMWVMEVGGIPVGQVRYGKVLWSGDLYALGNPRVGPAEAEIAISVVPNEQRKGYALTLLTETMPLARKALRVDTLVALVLRKNYASRHLFRRAGFRYFGLECRMEKMHVRYEK